ncbi:hypothetical protein D3C76_1494310 [compost metagenome]
MVVVAQGCGQCAAVACVGAGDGHQPAQVVVRERCLQVALAGGLEAAPFIVLVLGGHAPGIRARLQAVVERADIAYRALRLTGFVQGFADQLIMHVVLVDTVAMGTA